jgi:hypothetical protein
MPRQAGTKNDPSKKKYQIVGGLRTAMRNLEEGGPSLPHVTFNVLGRPCELSPEQIKEILDFYRPTVNWLSK